MTETKTSDATVSPKSDADGTVTAGISINRPKKNRNFIAKYGIVVIWIVEIIVFSAIEGRTFFSVSNFKEILSSQAALLILVLAVVPTLAVGEVDLSVASVMALSATLFGQLNGVDHVNMLLSLLVALVASILVGLANGLVTVYLRVTGMIVTLGMGTLVLGLTVEISHSLTVGGISLAFQHFVNKPIGGINLAFYLALFLVIVLWYLFKHTPAGRWMLFAGFNREVARLSGINVSRLRMFGFIIGSFLAGCAGVVAIGIAGGADPSSFQPLLLPAFAAAFLGSLIFNPGRINAFGSAVALYFLATGIVGIQLLGVGNWIDDAFYGGALVITVALSGLADIIRIRRKDS